MKTDKINHNSYLTLLGTGRLKRLCRFTEPSGSAGRCKKIADIFYNGKPPGSRQCQYNIIIFQNCKSPDWIFLALTCIVREAVFMKGGKRWAMNSKYWKK